MLAVRLRGRCYRWVGSDACLKLSSSPPLAARSGGPTRVPRRHPPDDLAAQIVTARARQGARARPRHRSRTSSSAAASRRASPASTSPGSSPSSPGSSVPGVTVNRYCSSSLQTIRMAAHAIKAGEGDVFIAGGVETVSRFGAGFADTAPNPRVQAGRAAHARAGRRRAAAVVAARGPARHLHRHGPDRRERARVRGRVAQRRWTSSPSSPRTAPWPTRRTASSPTRSRPVTLPDGTVVDEGRRPPCRRDAGRPRRPQAGVPPRRRGHRRQRLPAQRRRRGRAS